MALLFTLLVWIPILLGLIKKFGYPKVWGCSVTILVLVFLFASLKSCC